VNDLLQQQIITFSQQQFQKSYDFQLLTNQFFFHIDQLQHLIVFDIQTVESYQHEHSSQTHHATGIEPSLSGKQHQYGLYEKRIDWLATGSRRIFGTAVEKK
jgi:hypothetical protein